MSGIPRELIKWFQSLDLSVTIKNPKRDFSNGYMVAEVLSRYWRDISLHSFENGSSLICKSDNWALLDKICKKKGLVFTREMMEGVIHQRNGAVMPMIQLLYGFLTGRELKLQAVVEKAPVPAYAQPTLGQRLREAHTEAEHIENIITRETKQFQKKNENILDQHREALRSLKIADPERFQAKPKQVDTTKSTKVSSFSPELQQITVKSVDETLIQKRQLSRGRVESSNSKSSKHSRGGMGEESLESLGPLLSSTCGTCFTDLGVVFEAEAQEALRDQVQDGPAVSGAVGPTDYAAKFIANLTKLSEETRAQVWRGLQNAAPQIAKVIASRATEFATLTAFVGLILDTFSPTSTDWKQMELLIVNIGEHFVAKDPAIALTAFLIFFLNRIDKDVLVSQGSTAKRDSVLRMLRSYTAPAYHLTMIRGLQDFLTNGTLSPSADQLKSLDGLRPSSASVPTSNASLGVSMEMGALLLCLASLSSMEGDLAVNDEVVDLYLYYATIGLSMPSPSFRTASLRILKELALAGVLTPILKLLPKLKAIAEAHNEWWEVSSELFSLFSALLNNLNQVTPDDEPDGIQQEVMKRGVEMMQSLILFLNPRLPVRCRLMGATELAPHLTLPMPAFFRGDELGFGEFANAYTGMLLSLPEVNLMEILMMDPKPIRGTIQDYYPRQLVRMFSPLAAARGLVHWMESHAAESGQLSHGDMHRAMLMMAAGVLTERVVDEDNRAQWTAILESMGGHIRLAISTSSETPSETHSLVVQVVTKFFLELGTPAGDEELSDLEAQAFEWFVGRSQEE